MFLVLASIAIALGQPTAVHPAFAPGSTLQTGCDPGHPPDFDNQPPLVNISEWRSFAWSYVKDCLEVSPSEVDFTNIRFARVRLVSAAHRAVLGLVSSNDGIVVVEFLNRPCLFESWSEMKRVDRIRDVRVYLSRSAKLVRVEIEDSDSDSPLPPEPSGESAALQRANGGEEKWTAPPREVSPLLGLSDAIATLDRRGLGWSGYARLIIAHHVDWQFGRDLKGNQRPAVPVWSIDLRGVPPIPASQPVHPDAINHIRHIVDMTGKWRVALSTPQPDPPETGQTMIPPATPALPSTPSDKSSDGGQP